MVKNVLPIIDKKIHVWSKPIPKHIEKWNFDFFSTENYDIFQTVANRRIMAKDVVQVTK